MGPFTVYYSYMVVQSSIKKAGRGELTREVNQPGPFKGGADGARPFFYSLAAGSNDW